MTYPCDLLTCNRMELARQGLDSLVAPDAQLHDGVTVHGSVIGARARVAHAIAITDSLIFSDVTVGDSRDIYGSLMAPGLSLTCVGSTDTASLEAT